ncbi:zinc finger Ran-binding domain-containing protein 2-like [Apostichopus japonicus]
MSVRHVSEGDWVCDNEKCGNVNFARRTHCNRCGTGKSRSKIKAMGVPIGKQMAEKSHGLFSADDWQCKTCGNVNWARRGECNLCKMPKVGKVESRTGYGGGFNERENVEYNKKQDSDSDDEFDEFGRKKKKFRGKLPTIPLVTEAHSEVQAKKNSDKDNVDDDDDEDEDDGDLNAYKLDSDEDEEEGGDLNKYDLSSDEDEKKPEATVTSKASPPSSRSSSSGSRDSSSSSSSEGSRSSSAKRSKSPRRSSSSSSRSRSRSGSRSDSRSRKRRHSSTPSRSRSRSGSGSPDQYEPKKRR